MINGSKVGARLELNKIHYFPDTLDMMDTGMVPGGLYKNKKAFSKVVSLKNDGNENLSDLLYDPQTSGGLLIAVKPSESNSLVNRLKDSGEDAEIIGEITDEVTRITVI